MVHVRIAGATGRMVQRDGNRYMSKIKYGHGRNDLMIIAAVRYCLGRSSYIVNDCCEWLIESWPQIPEKTRGTIRRDIEDEFKRDDEDRAEGRQHKALGWDCDRQDWERVRKLWSNPK